MTKYKISDDPLKLREYGRNVQMMVDYCKTLEDRDMRNALAYEIVRIMMHMNPNLREGTSAGAEYEQKIWDHFYHLAEFEIDVDSPYAMPTPDSMFTRPPERMPYYNQRSRFRQYGRNVELMAEEALKIGDMDERHALVTVILNIMKMHIRAEKDSNAEIIVCEHLKVMSNGQLDYNPGDIKFHKFSQHAPIQASNTNQSHGGRKKKKHHKKKRR